MLNATFWAIFKHCETVSILIGQKPQNSKTELKPENLLTDTRTDRFTFSVENETFKVIFKHCDIEYVMLLSFPLSLSLLIFQKFRNKVELVIALMQRLREFRDNVTKIAVFLRLSRRVVHGV